MPTAATTAVIIDEVPEMTELLAVVLHLRQVRPTLMASGLSSKTLEQLKTQLAVLQPGLLILDIPPPYAEKLALARELLSAFPECPAILMTTGIQELSQSWADSPGVWLLGKPFDLEDVLGAIDVALESGRRHASCRIRRTAAVVPASTRSKGQPATEMVQAGFVPEPAVNAGWTATV